MAGWMYLWFPDLYLHNLDAATPREPVAILDPQEQRIVQLNAPAQALGVRRDMPLASALFLCPALTTRTLSLSHEQQLLQQRALWAGHYASFISLHAPQGLWLEVGSMLKLFGGLSAYWQRIQQDCEEQHWPVHIATGHTPLAARWLALANAGEPTFARDKLLPRLQALALDELPLSDAQRVALQRLGIHSLEQLLRLPLADVGQRVDVELMNTLRQLNGDAPHPLTPFDVPPSFSQHAECLHDIEHRNGILFPLKRLLEGLCGFLHQQQLATRELILTLTHREPPDSVWRFALASPEYRYPELVQLCRYQLEKQRLRAPATALRLDVAKLSSRAPAQSNDLLAHKGADREQTNQHQHAPQTGLLNRLASRLEAEQLQCLYPTGDPRPECAWHTMSAAEHSTISQLQKATHVRSHRGHWPFWVLPHPSPCSAPTTLIAGPARLDSGWWDHAPIRRDYYQALLGNQLAWVFRDDRGQWFIHGFYS